MFYKNYRKNTITRFMWKIYGLELSILAVYYVCVGTMILL